MTVFLGQATLSGNTVQIEPPLGFGAVDSVRLTNFTPDVLILTNINGRESSQEYLMPLQQMVYRTQDVTQIPTITGVALGSSFPVSQVFVEWSNNGLVDFPGTYPIEVTEPATSSQSWVAGVVTLTDTGITYTIPGDPLRQSTTVINSGSTTLNFLPTDGPWIAPVPSLVAGASFTLRNGAEIYLRTEAAGGQATYFGETL